MLVRVTSSLAMRASASARGAVRAVAAPALTSASPVAVWSGAARRAALRAVAGSPVASLHSSPCRAMRVSRVLAAEEGEKEAAKPAAEGAAEGATPTPEAPATPSAEERIAKLEAELKEAKEARLRALAEVENMRRITARDVEQARTFGIQKFAKSLLDVADNLERALESIPASEREKDDANNLFSVLLTGISAVDVNLKKLFREYGIVPFGAVGEKFDPTRHEAMFQMPAPAGVDPNCIGQVLKIGYMFKDRVLRPAQVGTTLRA